MTVKVSVITPVLNGEKFLRQTVDSVLSQKGDFELEYIVRDGESTDGTLEILSSYGDSLKVLSKKDGSPQEAINAGMAQATGDIACWLNADDVFLPGTLQNVVDTFNQNPDKHWLYGRCSIIDQNNNEIRRPITWYKNILGFFYSRNVLLCENFINQPATFWRREFWAQCNALNSKYKAAWDYDLWLKMAERSPAKHIRKYLAKFRRHEGSISEHHFVKQFAEELEIAGLYGNRLHWMIHKLNQLKIITIYKMLS